MRKPREKAPAFTLVELLIAVAVSTVLVVAVSLVISAGMRTFASASGAGENDLRRIMLVSALSQDVASAMPLNGIGFTGERMTMSFPRMLSLTHATNAVTVMTVTWELSPDRGIVRTLTSHDGTSTSDTFGRFPHLLLSYAGDEDGDHPPDVKAVAWQERWSRNRFPGVVRIDVGDFAFDVGVACSDFALDGKEGGR